MNVIETTKLTKYYGKSRGIVDLDMSVARGRDLRLHRPERRREVDDDPHAARPDPPHQRLGDDLRQGHHQARPGDPRGRRLPALGGLLLRRHARDRPAEVLGELLQEGPEGDREADPRLAELFDLDLKKKIDDLSYGNKKKVGIIQGLAHEPKLIILDEPTGGLDPLIQQQFFHLLKEENAKGATILFSSHILSEVQKLCDRVAIIKDGTIIKVEEIRTLLENATKRFKLELAGEPDPCGVPDRGRERPGRRRTTR